MIAGNSDCPCQIGHMYVLHPLFPQDIYKSHSLFWIILSHCSHFYYLVYASSNKLPAITRLCEISLIRFPKVYHSNHIYSMTTHYFIICCSIYPTRPYGNESVDLWVFLTTILPMACHNTQPNNHYSAVSTGGYHF